MILGFDTVAAAGTPGHSLLGRLEPSFRATEPNVTFSRHGAARPAHTNRREDK